MIGVDAPEPKIVNLVSVYCRVIANHTATLVIKYYNSVLFYHMLHVDLIMINIINMLKFYFYLFFQC